MSHYIFVAKTNRVASCRMDVLEDPTTSTTTATLELPGLKKEEISLRIHDGSLVVWGERHSRLLPPTKGASPPSDGAPKRKLASREIKYGKFRRVIPLPPGVQVSHLSPFSKDPQLNSFLQTNQISASMGEGMLTVTWPNKVESAASSA
jgi:HSP20 family protein